MCSKAVLALKSEHWKHYQQGGCAQHLHSSLFSPHLVRAAHNQPHASKSSKLKQLSWHVAGHVKDQGHAINWHMLSYHNSLPSCTRLGATSRQMCPAAAVNVTEDRRHCWRLDCCCAQLHTVCFVPLTAAVLHCSILLCVMGFDSMYCTLWVGKSCLVCSSSDLCPGHSYHLHLAWHLADVQSAQALCEGTVLASSHQQPGLSSRNDSSWITTRMGNNFSPHIRFPLVPSQIYLQSSSHAAEASTPQSASTSAALLIYTVFYYKKCVPYIKNLSFR